MTSATPVRGAWTRVLAAFALTLLAALAAAAVTAAPASAISDYDTAPSASWVIDTAGGTDVATDVAVNSGGAAYVCGTVWSGPGDLDGSLYKFPPSGAGWRRTWGGPAHANDAFNAVAVARDGSVYTAGVVRNAAGQLDWCLVKWSSAGARVWSRRYTGPVAGDDFATDVVVDKNGNVTVCGDSLGARGKAFTVVSWSAAGTRRWVYRTDSTGSDDDRATALVVDGTGNLYVTGWRYRTGIGKGGYTVKLSPAGLRRWSDQYQGADTVELVTIVKRPSGGVFVGGSMLSSDTAWDGLVIRYSASGGRLVCGVDADGGDSVDIRFRSLALASGGTLVAGGSRASDYGNDVRRYVRLYDAATGELGGWTLWAGAGVDDEWIVAVAADAYGGYYLTGTTAETAAHDLVWTLRRSVIAGGAVWAGEFGGGDVGHNAPTAMTTWKTTVWVVGKVHAGGGDADQMVLKYVY